MLKGTCPKCGRHFVGWALHSTRYQACSKCGAGLLITDDSRTVSKGYSPFTADRYFINKPERSKSPHEAEKDNNK